MSHKFLNRANELLDTSNSANSTLAIVERVETPTYFMCNSKQDTGVKSKCSDTHIKPEKVLDLFKIVSAGKTYFHNIPRCGYAESVKSYRKDDNLVKNIIGIKGDSIWDWATKYSELSQAIAERFSYFIDSLSDEFNEKFVFFNKNQHLNIESRAAYFDSIDKKLTILFNFLIRKEFTTFSNSNLSSLDLSKMTFKPLNQEYVELHNCNLYNTSFEKSKFINVDFNKSQLRYSNFSGSTFINCKFNNVNIEYAAFNNCQLKNCSFDFCKINTFTSFINSNFSHVTFHLASGHINLQYATLIENLDLSTMALHGIKMNISHKDQIHLPMTFLKDNIIYLNSWLNNTSESQNIGEKYKINVSKISGNGLKHHILNNDFKDCVTFDLITQYDTVVFIKDFESIRIYKIETISDMLAHNIIFHPSSRNYFFMSDFISQDNIDSIDITKIAT